MPRRIISGQKMRRFPTRDFNEAVASSQSRFHRHLPGGGAALNGIVKIRNDSGKEVLEGDPLGITGLMVEYTDNEPEFRRMPGFLGDTPDALAHGLNWVIAQEPMGAGSIGRAVYRGLCVAPIELRNIHHTHARFRTDGDTEAVQMWSDFGGVARIVAVPRDLTGDEWAVLDMRADSDWWADGYLTGTLDAATIVSAKVAAETVGVRIWLRDADGNIATDTGDEITAYNTSESTSGLEDFYARLRFDGTFWRIDALDCDASGLPGAS